MTDIQASIQPTCIPALEEVSTPTSATFLNFVTSDLTIQTIQQQMQMRQQLVEMMKPNNQKSKKRDTIPTYANIVGHLVYVTIQVLNVKYLQTDIKIMSHYKIVWETVIVISLETSGLKKELI